VLGEDPLDDVLARRRERDGSGAPVVLDNGWTAR